MFTLNVEVDGRTFEQFDTAATHLEATLEKEAAEGMVRASRSLLQTLQRVSAQIMRRHSNPWNGSVVNNSTSLQRRSGNGLLSVAKSVKLTAARGDLIAGEISTADLTIHETGGTVTTKKSKFLTIPLPAAMDARGVPLRKSARDWQDTFVARSKKGALLIFQRRGSDVVPLYILKKSVRIPARLGMEDSLTSQLSYFEQKAVEQIANAFDI